MILSKSQLNFGMLEYSNKASQQSSYFVGFKNKLGPIFIPFFFLFFLKKMGGGYGERLETSTR